MSGGVRPVLLLGLLAAATAAPAADVAWRKAGLWDVSLRQEDQSIMRSVRVQQCSAPAAEPAILLSIVPGQEECAPPVVQRSGDSVDIRTDCRVHEVKLAAYLTMAGDFEARYQGRFTVTTGAAQRPATVFTATWLGPCREGMKVGDMVLSNGITVNVLKDRQHREDDGHRH